jgi:hypothetical protein
MTDTDWLGFGDEQDRRAAQGPALISYPPKGRRELVVAEEMHRKADDPACNKVLFTTVTDAGEEVLEEALVWQRIMEWIAREPTVAEVEAYQLYARMSRLAEWWTRLGAAKAADDAEPDLPNVPKPKGAPE